MLEGIKSIGIVGAGQMGRGIAQVAAMTGYSTIIFDISEDSLETAFANITKQLKRGVEKNKWDEAHVSSTMNNLSRATELTALKDCDIVIEAATENKKIKFDIFKNLDELCKPECILASNTSSISISEIASHTSREDKVVGMHFMNPVPVMKLVEGIRGDKTDEKIFDITAALAQSMGKVFVRSNDAPGFIVNRVLMPMINEAVFAVHDGVASPEDVDAAMKLGTNQPMGPLVLADFIGLDTCLAIMNVLYDGFKTEKYKPCPLLEKYVEEGRLGRKVKHGFYKY